MNISKTAKAANLPVKTVRYYADIGLVSPATRSASGYREYDDREVQLLVFVRRARAFGFSIDECRELIDLYTDQRRSSADVKKIASEKLAEIEEKLHELQILREELTLLVNKCHGDARPDCPILAHLDSRVD